MESVTHLTVKEYRLLLARGGLAAAELLDRELSRSGVMRAAAAGDDAIAGALQRYAGFGGDGKQVSNVENYARASFAYDVLLSLDRGVNDNGIKVPERAVAWERAFPADLLVKLEAPLVPEKANP